MLTSLKWLAYLPVAVGQMTFICVGDLPRNLMALLSKMFFPAQGMSQLSDGQGFTMGTLLARVYTAALSPEDRPCCANRSPLSRRNLGVFTLKLKASE